MRHLPRIAISAIEHAAQRYDTCGDYSPVEYGEAMRFTISRMADWRSEAAVLLHELLEWTWCEQNAVSGAVIDAWDLSHGDAQEPGEVQGCPYGAGHALATVLERQHVEALGLTWAEHERIVADACKEWVPKTGSPAAGG